MDGQIGLTVPIEIQRAHPHALFHGRFEDARQNLLAVPSDVPRNAYLKGN
jgi:hypothetical protein